MSRLLALALLFASSVACVGPRPPRAFAPFTVRLVGASDAGLRGTSRNGHSVFSGSVGRDYAVEVTNGTSGDIAIAILIDGLDAKTGERAESCEDHATWIVPGNGIVIMRGFSISKTRIATYRFTTRDQSLAAFTKNARPERIGTVEVCFFSTRPRPVDVAGGNDTSPDSAEAEPTTWGTHEARTPSVTGEIREEAIARVATSTDADLIARVFVTYEGESGALGTAPPPLPAARPASTSRVGPGVPPPEPPELPVDETKPGKPTKPPKPGKPTKPPNPMRMPDKYAPP